jgi:peptidoglycan hydrolase-like protein with peptidoglycan-binding domain
MTTAVNRSSATQPARSPGADDDSRYTVQRGDTLSAIAQQKNVSLDDLVNANPQIRDPNKINVGQELNIPNQSASGAAGAQTAGGVTDAASGQTDAATATDAATPRADAATVQGSRARAGSADAEARARVEADVGNVPSSAPERRALNSTGTLRRGAEGPAVRDLQEQLNARGANLTVDGDFGRDTRNAVRAFQRENGLLSDGVVGNDTRAAFARTASQPNTGADGANGTNDTPSTDGASGTSGVTTPDVGTATATLRQGMEGPAVEQLQTRLNEVAGANLKVDGDFGPATRRAVEDFQSRAGIDSDGVAGPETRQAMDEVAAGTRQLAEAPPVGPQRPSGPQSQSVTVDGNTFNVHNMTRSEFGRTSVPGNRIIAMDANSASGRQEILRPLIVIPNNATPAERAAAQQSVDRMAEFFNRHDPGSGRATTGIVRTTAENGRGLNGFFHTEFHSVNDDAAVRAIKENPQEYARIMGQTLGSIDGANFIVPHGNRRGNITDPGAVSRDGQTSEVSLARHVIEHGFSGL